MATEEDDRRESVGRAVLARRLELGLTKEEASRRGLLNSITWTRVEEGKRVRDDSYAKVETALQWPPGRLAAELGRTNIARIEAGADGQIVVRSHEWYEQERDWVRQNFGPGADRDWLIDKLDRDEDAARTASRERSKLTEAWERLGRSAAN
jgi:hypothetical protein